MGIDIESQHPPMAFYALKNNLFIINELQTLFQSASYHAAISVVSCGKVAHFTQCFAVFYMIKCPNIFTMNYQQRQYSPFSLK